MFFNVFQRFSCFGSNFIGIASNKRSRRFFAKDRSCPVTRTGCPNSVVNRRITNEGESANPRSNGYWRILRPTISPVSPSIGAATAAPHRALSMAQGMVIPVSGVGGTDDFPWQTNFVSRPERHRSHRSACSSPIVITSGPRRNSACLFQKAKPAPTRQPLRGVLVCNRLHYGRRRFTVRKLLAPMPPAR